MPKEIRNPKSDWRRVLNDSEREDSAFWTWGDDDVAGRDFKNKIGTSRKESKETMFFLRMVAASEEALADAARILWREAKELNLIFGSMWRK